MKYLLIFLFLICSLSLPAFQEDEEATMLNVPEGEGEKEWASPGVVGDRPSKGIVISYNTIAPFKIKSVPMKDGLEGGAGQLQKLEEFAFSLRLPVSWRGRTKIIAGLGYAYEEYNFRSPGELKYDFYENLENKHLNSLSFQSFLLHSLDRRRFIGSRLSAELNGDYHDLILPFHERMKFSAAALYGWKQDAYTTYGFGIYYSYTMGRPSVYPAFLWSSTFNPKWGVEALLPQSFRLRYTFNPKAYLLAGMRVSGNSYHIVSKAPPLSGYPNLELRNSNIFGFIEFERELYDFLWLGITGGFRYNVNFYISEENSFSNYRILENKLDPSPYLNVGLFIVPPRKLLNRSSATPKEGP